MQTLLPAAAGYTLPEAARLLGIHDKSIYRLVKQGKVQTFSGLDDRLRISREEIYHYLREQGDEMS